jgi:hypothetical protein
LFAGKPATTRRNVVSLQFWLFIADMLANAACIEVFFRFYEVNSRPLILLVAKPFTPLFYIHYLP